MSFLHGKYEVTEENQMFLVKLSGSFNKQGTEAYIKDITARVEALNGRPFGMLIDDLELEGGTPEAYAALNEYNTWMTSQNIVAKALVIDNEAKKHIILANAPAISRQNIAFFESFESAYCWLKGKMAALG